MIKLFILIFKLLRFDFMGIIDSKLLLDLVNGY